MLSDVEVEHGSDFNDFLRAHIERIAGGDDTKLFHFHEGAEVEAWLSSLADGTADFVGGQSCHGGEDTGVMEKFSPPSEAQLELLKGLWKQAGFDCYIA